MTAKSGFQMVKEKASKLQEQKKAVQEQVEQEDYAKEQELKENAGSLKKQAGQVRALFQDPRYPILTQFIDRIIRENTAQAKLLAISTKSTEEIGVGCAKLFAQVRIMEQLRENPENIIKDLEANEKWLKER